MSVLEEYFSEDNLRLAFQRYLRWQERMIKDRSGIKAFSKDLNKNIEKLSDSIIRGNYKPQVPFKFYMPKSSGTQRTKTLLMIEDALVYQSIANMLAQQCYEKLAVNENFVFGSILTPETKLGVQLLKVENAEFFFFKHWKHLFLRFRDSVNKAINLDKAKFKLETDITGFFDSVPHYNLLERLSNEFSVDDQILDLLSNALSVWSGTKTCRTPGVGIPQGPVPSYLLANLLLHDLDSMMISGAFKYYRYMDDIKVYGYDEKELRDVLVKLDNYLKSTGLSINSKKTSIVEISELTEDETLAEMNKIQIVFSSYLDGETDAVASNFDEIESDRDLPNMIEQSGEEMRVFHPKKFVITKEQEIENFWIKECEEVERELPGFFNNDEPQLSLKDKVGDIDFIKQSAKYGTALRSLKEMGVNRPPDKNLLPLWIYAVEHFFWRANSFLLTLQNYKQIGELKEHLDRILSNMKNYEWVRYQILIYLTYNMVFTDRELRSYFKMLQSEDSSLVRYAAYGLLIKHNKDDQLRSSIRRELSMESEQYLKFIVADYWKKDESRPFTMIELTESIGL